MNEGLFYSGLGNIVLSGGFLCYFKGGGAFKGVLIIIIYDSRKSEVDSFFISDFLLSQTCHQERMYKKYYKSEIRPRKY